LIYLARQGENFDTPSGEGKKAERLSELHTAVKKIQSNESVFMIFEFPFLEFSLSRRKRENSSPVSEDFSALSYQWFVSHA